MRNERGGYPSGDTPASDLAPPPSGPGAGVSRIPTVAAALRALQKEWATAAKRRYIFTKNERAGGERYGLSPEAYREIWERAQGDALGICSVQLQPLIAMLEREQRWDPETDCDRREG